MKILPCNIYSYFLLILLHVKISNQQKDQQKISVNVVQAWSERLGFELLNLGEYCTRKKEVAKSYEKAQILPRKGATILEDMAKELKNVFDSRESATKRLMDAAENTALSDDGEPVDHDYQYYNAKEMIEIPQFGTLTTEPPIELNEIEAAKPKPVPQKEIILTDSKKFGVPVNTTLSSVIPYTNVYDRAPEVIRSIKWSEALNNIFIDNYEKDPSLSWQYFGSSTGFLRQFPATKWDTTPVDLYDGRLRSWYIEAANSPKDVIILIDNSGSMTGQRRDVARHVVLNILEALGSNDFVNVLTFNETVNEVVPCFKDTLVQANMLNKNEFNLQLDDIETKAIANFSAALIKAFEMLSQFKADGLGAQCNQMIMLVSDGVPFTFSDIFEEYNWQDKPEIPVRMFTYLVGREVADVDKIKWMACENLGYYVHLSTFAEVREDVINFIQVLARPLVLQKDHPVIWSEVYADVVDPKLTEYEWELEERREQKEIFRPKVNETMHFPHDIRRWWEKRGIGPDYNTKKFNFMITVSMPVFDRRENATRIANLLGVVATDLPIKDLQRIMMPFMLGVNGYAFLVSNNGYIIAHPDHRPIFLDILKPTYNSVDLLEVELIDDDRPIRDFNQFLYSIREAMINQTSGSKWVFVKQHYDSMKRVSRTKRLYFWKGIVGTPYTLVVTFPETYGANRVQIRNEEEIHRIHAKGNNILNFFSGSNWKVHPDWLYCKHSTKEFETPEEELLYFLKRMRQPGWKWPLIRTPVPPEIYAALYSHNGSNRSGVSEKDRYYCDRGLMQEMVYDAKVTEWFIKNFTNSIKEEKRAEFKERFGVTTVFLATHSGLTRWNSLNNINGEPSLESEFGDTNNRAIDEVWYKRAVEQHFVEKESFVYSVPFSNENPYSTLVTASHAVFITDDNKSAPVAVVGFQFQLSSLEKLFNNVTGSCSQDPTNCKFHCGSDEMNCYVVDNHGYIVLSPGLEETGKFFGEIRGDIMQRLIDDGIYKRIYVYDYQAVCFYEKGNMNTARSLQSFVKFWVKGFFYMLQYTATIVTYFFSLISQTLAENVDEYLDSYDDMTIPTLSSEESAKEKDQKFYKLLRIPKTRPQTCDQIITLYQINVDRNDKAFQTPAKDCERPFVITPIPGTNLYLLVLDNVCPVDDLKLTTDPVEQEYTNSSLACFKTEFNNFYRRRPSKCIRKHELEPSIVLCGDANKPIVTYFLGIICILAFLFR